MQGSPDRRHGSIKDLNMAFYDKYLSLNSFVNSLDAGLVIHLPVSSLLDGRDHLYPQAPSPFLATKSQTDIMESDISSA